MGTAKRLRELRLKGLEFDHNDSSILLRATLNDVLELYDSNSLHGNENSHGGYGGGPDRYLDTENEDLQNLVHEEMNRSHQLVQDEDLSISEGEEYDHGEDGVEEEEGAMHDDSYTDEQYTSGPVEVTTVILDHNHELEPTLSYFLPCHRELTKNLKRSLVAHDIAGLRSTKRIRFWEFEAGGPELGL
ncbi:hypothetical protein CQW23_21434 [Capsicum baccatum]|uniref:Uncharacterized protein n=1 Tax=Capsicum baccatum TaxID=33114 RepID=A0A2G2VY23_CAPBA|nr:hypothetical protein CQW23_21434 [Capsicum baccatum]